MRHELILGLEAVLQEKVKERVKAKAKTEEKVNDSSRRKGKRKALVLLMKQLVRKDLSPLRPLVIS
jgi:hypothetical protein